MTLIIMLILAGISLSGVIGGKGLFKRTKDASNTYNEKKAREVLETVLLTDGQFEKNTNPKYNQEDFLDELIKKEIPGSNVIEDVAIIGGEYAYELDRSVPKIGHYLGNPKDLIWPKVTTTDPALASDNRSASFKITATIDEKATKGITRIEVWLLGEMIKEYKYTDNTKDTRTETFETNRNGEYTIKAYADLKGSTQITVEGIVPAVEFMPNGNTEWKKEHSTKIIVKETGEKIKSLKYKWTNSVKAPEIGDFSDAENCNNNDTITGRDFTGTYYLWVLLEMDTTPIKTNICGSKGFNFDNTNPYLILRGVPLTANSFNLEAYAQSKVSGLRKVEIYVDGVPKIKKEFNASKSYECITTEVDNLTSGIHDCFALAYDISGNIARCEIQQRTKWAVWYVSTGSVMWEYEEPSEWILAEEHVQIPYNHPGERIFYIKKYSYIYKVLANELPKIENQWSTDHNNLQVGSWVPGKPEWINGEPYLVKYRTTEKDQYFIDQSKYFWKGEKWISKLYYITTLNVTNSAGEVHDFDINKYPDGGIVGNQKFTFKGWE